MNHKPEMTHCLILQKHNKERIILLTLLAKTQKHASDLLYARLQQGANDEKGKMSKATKIKLVIALQQTLSIAAGLVVAVPVGAAVEFAGAALLWYINGTKYDISAGLSRTLLNSEPRSYASPEGTSSIDDFIDTRKIYYTHDVTKPEILSYHGLIGLRTKYTQACLNSILELRGWNPTDQTLNECIISGYEIVNLGLKDHVAKLSNNIHLIEITHLAGLMTADVVRGDAWGAVNVSRLITPHNSYFLCGEPLIAAMDGQWEYSYKNLPKRVTDYCISITKDEVSRAQWNNLLLSDNHTMHDRVLITKTRYMTGGKDMLKNMEDHWELILNLFTDCLGEMSAPYDLWGIGQPRTESQFRALMLGLFLLVDVRDAYLQGNILGCVPNKTRRARSLIKLCVLDIVKSCADFVHPLCSGRWDRKQLKIFYYNILRNDAWFSCGKLDQTYAQFRTETTTNATPSAFGMLEFNNTNWHTGITTSKLKITHKNQKHWNMTSGRRTSVVMTPAAETRLSTFTNASGANETLSEKLEISIINFTDNYQRAINDSNRAVEGINRIIGEVHNITLIQRTEALNHNANYQRAQTESSTQITVLLNLIVNSLVPLLKEDRDQK